MYQRLPHRIKSALKYIRRLLHASKVVRAATARTIQDRWIGQYLPTKPVVLQFPVNDICNSKCVMCDIWKRKRDKELTADELAQILADPLFNKVQYVGISGGEPTLRRDLPEIGLALAQTLPSIKGFGIISNAVQSESVAERIVGLATVARNHKLDFTAMLSLDGVRDDHDRNRGVNGNYNSVLQVIKRLRTEQLAVGVGCTLTPENCYGADELLEWCENSDLQFWEFRLGVDIKRLYNDGYTARNAFTPEERFHLAGFFEKLAAHPRVDLTHRLFYRSLMGQLAYGSKRAAGCDWRSRGVTLDTRGNISYCSVESPILESALDESAWTIYRRNLSKRREIIRSKCDSCQHDLIGTPPLHVALDELGTTVMAPIKQRWNVLRPKLLNVRIPPKCNAPQRERPSTWQNVLITGWYGTETAGDKAILGELVHFVRSRSPDCQITITTMDRKVSQQTNREIDGLQDAALVDLHDATSSGVVDSCDAVLFGGGPLEEIPALEKMLEIFAEANRRRKARVVFGCGVGPLYSDRLRKIVSGLFRLTTAGFVRDYESWVFAQELGASKDLGCACDPALGYLLRWDAEHSRATDRSKGRRTVTGLLRANTSEYINDMNSVELESANDKVARQLGEMLYSSAVQLDSDVSLLPMHSLWVGGDDRIFNRKISTLMPETKNVLVERRYLGLHDLLSAIQASDVVVAMRYHGHLFSMALGIPFLSIDYTGSKGKVASFLSRAKYEQWSEDWRSIDTTRAVDRIRSLMEDRTQWSCYLKAKTREMVQSLEKNYVTVFPE